MRQIFPGPRPHAELEPTADESGDMWLPTKEGIDVFLTSMNQVLGINDGDTKEALRCHPLGQLVSFPRIRGRLHQNVLPYRRQPRTTRHLDDGLRTTKLSVFPRARIEVD